MAKLTADTITDEQIGKLRQQIDRMTGHRTGKIWREGRLQMHDCLVANGMRAAQKGEKRRARERCARLLARLSKTIPACAEILNARAEVKP